MWTPLNVETPPGGRRRRGAKLIRETLLVVAKDGAKNDTPARLLATQSHSDRLRAASEEVFVARSSRMEATPSSFSGFRAWCFYRFQMQSRMPSATQIKTLSSPTHAACFTRRTRMREDELTTSLRVTCIGNQLHIHVRKKCPSVRKVEGVRLVTVENIAVWFYWSLRSDKYTKCGE